MLDQLREGARALGPASADGGGESRFPQRAVAVILAVVLALVLPGGGQSAYARAELWSTSGKVLGNATAAKVDSGTRVQLRAHDLPVGGGAVYELWCVRKDGRWINGGSFQARADGTAAAELTAAVRPGEYHVVVDHAALGRRRARRRGHARQAHLLNLLRAACVHPAMRLLSPHSPALFPRDRGCRMRR